MHSNQVAHQARAYPDFSSMDGMLGYRSKDCPSYQISRYP